MVLGTPQSTRKFIDINQNIDNLNDSELTGGNWQNEKEYS